MILEPVNREFMFYLRIQLSEASRRGVLARTRIDIARNSHLSNKDY